MNAKLGLRQDVYPVLQQLCPVCEQPLPTEDFVTELDAALFGATSVCPKCGKVVTEKTFRDAEYQARCTWFLGATASMTKFQAIQSEIAKIFFVDPETSPDHITNFSQHLDALKKVLEKHAVNWDEFQQYFVESMFRLNLGGSEYLVSHMGSWFSRAAISATIRAANKR